MVIRSSLSREGVAAAVCDALDRAGIRVVLSGEAVVSIYTENEYESFDLDFIQSGLARAVDSVMTELGFAKQGRHWIHPATRFWVEFPPGPVQVGDAVVTEFAERRTAMSVLRLLTPTECVMDRLAGYFHWNDPQCLDQAVLVARRHPVDLERIEAWSRRESSFAKFERFREHVNHPSKS
jgi:hypothetical protein